MFQIRKILFSFFIIFFLIPSNKAFSASNDFFKSGDWKWFGIGAENHQTLLADENKAPFDLRGDPVLLNIFVKRTGGESEINKIFKLQFSDTSDFSGEVSFVSASSTCEQRSIWCYGDKEISNIDSLQSATTTLSFSLKNIETDYKKTAYFFRLYDPENNRPIDYDNGKSYPSIVSKGTELLFNINDLSVLNSSTDGRVPSLIFNLSLSRGEKWQSQIVFVNRNKKDVFLELKAKDFEEKESSFAPIIKTDGDSNLKGYFASKWFKFPIGKITIGKNSRVAVPFTVEIPLSAEPGNYRPGIIPNVFFELNNNNASTSESSVELSPSIVSLSIKGSTRERGRVKDFSTDNVFYYNPNINLNLKFENFGDVHLMPMGWLKIYDFWGNELDIDKQYSSLKFDTVEPGEILNKVFNLNLSDSSFGYYNVALNILYGDADKQKIEKNINFFVVPTNFWTNVALSLAGIFLFFKFGIRFILNKSKRGSSRKIKIN